MSEPFALRTAEDARWTIHPPHDPHGGGHVFKVRTELHEDGMTAATVACVDGVFIEPRIDSLSVFVEALAADWRGWSGVRTWASMDRQLVVDAEHDGRGHVSLGVALRGPRFHRGDTAWTARAVFALEAGEELTQLAADLAHLLRI